MESLNPCIFFCFLISCSHAVGVVNHVDVVHKLCNIGSNAHADQELCLIIWMRSGFHDEAKNNHEHATQAS